MATAIKTAWTHKVVKIQRGSQGQWFWHRAAATFSGESEAIEYAERFAVAQSGILRTRILVVRRRGERIVKDIPVK